MNTPLTLSLMLFLALSCPTGAFAAPGGPGAELSMRLGGIAPADVEDWDTVGTLEGQLRLWGSPAIGLALTAGAQWWTVPSEFEEGEDSVGYYSYSITGDASVIPVGASLLLRHEVVPGALFTFELGGRYAMVDSAIRVDSYAESPTDAVWIAEDIEIEDTVLGVMGVELAMRMGPSALLGVGLSYQVDLGNPRETLLEEDIGSTRFSGFGGYLSLGLTF